MKLYEIRHLRDDIINEGMLDRVPARFRKVIGGIVAAMLLAAPQPTSNQHALQQQAHDAAQSVQALPADQYKDLMSSFKRIEPIIKKPLEKEGIQVGSMIDHIAGMSAQELAKELGGESSSWVQHEVDDKTLMMKPGVLKKAEYAIEYFVSKGMNRHAAIGIVGGFIQESQLDEKAVNRSSGAVGIAQWLGDRAKDVPEDFRGQLEYVWDELQQKPHSTTYGMLQRANSLGRLVYAANRYERFEGWKQGGRGNLTGTEHGHRTEYIKLLAKLFGKGDELAQKIATAKPLQV